MFADSGEMLLESVLSLSHRVVVVMVVVLMSSVGTLPTNLEKISWDFGTSVWRKNMGCKTSRSQVRYSTVERNGIKITLVWGKSPFVFVSSAWQVEVEGNDANGA